MSVENFGSSGSSNYILQLNRNKSIFNKNRKNNGKLKTVNYYNYYFIKPIINLFVCRDVCVCNKNQAVTHIDIIVSYALVVLGCCLQLYLHNNYAHFWYFNWWWHHQFVCECLPKWKGRWERDRVRGKGWGNNGWERKWVRGGKGLGSNLGGRGVAREWRKGKR